MHIKNLKGINFGRLIPRKISGRDEVSRCVIWECICECGNIVEVKSNSLTTGNTKSCGCLQKDRATKSNKSRIIHGKCDTKLYRTWTHMKDRCLNSNDKSYDDYGGRGIKIYGKWLEFKNFYKWAIKSGYGVGLTIERIDVNGNYCPENCTWATRKEQNNNKRDNVILEHKGKKKTLAEWADEIGMNYNTLYNRIYTGWPVEKALTTPLLR